MDFTWYFHKLCEYELKVVKFQVFTVMSMKMVVFWYVAFVVWLILIDDSTQLTVSIRVILLLEAVSCCETLVSISHTT
jgi:hypothetical protein